jgi:hypothetical protein
MVVSTKFIIFTYWRSVQTASTGRLLPEHQFREETRFRHRLRLDTYSHYPIHAQAIREWQEKRRNG